jgi:hypothetical protein
MTIHNHPSRHDLHNASQRVCLIDLRQDEVLLCNIRLQQHWGRQAETLRSDPLFDPTAEVEPFECELVVGCLIGVEKVEANWSIDL